MRRLWLIAGEPSGDQHGAALAAQWDAATLTGVAGPAMRRGGVTPFFEMEELAVMGFSDTLKRLPSLYQRYRMVSEQICRENPDAVILIDFQEFNMRLARRLRKGGYRGAIVQHISPSVWAWRPGRAQFLSRYLDLLLTIYPFEARYYAATPLQTRYIGNPIVEAAIKEQQQDRERCNRVALFPGSRSSEVALNLPLQLRAAAELKERYPSIEVVVSVASPELQPAIEASIAASPLNEVTTTHDKYTLMATSSAAIATSGTATLELAIMQCPTAVTYQLTRINRLVAGRLLRIHLPHYCIVNIIAATRLFPEWIETAPTSLAIADAVEQFLSDTPERRRCLEGCAALAEQLAVSRSPAAEAASAIEELLP